MHGFACSLEDWRPQLAFFEKTHHVAACDLRGHGATPGRPQECSIEHYGGDVAALIHHLDLKHCILVGHSMGCRVVLEANRLTPDRVGGIVLVDGSRNATGDADATEAAARATIQKLGYAAFAETLFRQMFFTPSAQATAIVERAVKNSAEVGPHLWPRVTRWDAGQMDAAFDAVRAPLLAIQSTTRDASLKRRMLAPGDTTPWLDYVKLKGGRVEIVPNVGHFTQLEAPDAVSGLIQQLIRGRSPN